MYVKICGVMDVATAKKVRDCGGDAIGLVFTESPRRVGLFQAKEIARAVPGIKKFGLFVNEERDLVSTIARNVGLDVLQFHGDETPEYCESFQEEYEVIKAFRVRDEDSLRAIANYTTLRRIILDAYVPGQRGGTGKRLDLDLVEKAKRYDKEIMLAGGLTPENVREAVLAKVWGVDTSSGVEVKGQKGVKDHGKIERFIDNARIQSILWEIIEEKEKKVIRLHDRQVMERIKAKLKIRGPEEPSLYDVLAVEDQGPKLIAEIKYDSPSNAGNPPFTEFSPEQVSWVYSLHGAKALSVITDEKFFKGHIKYLERVARARKELPVLRKDFVIDGSQVYEARAAGAAAVLLISEILDVGQMTDLILLAEDLGMHCLVESHGRRGLKKAEAAGAKIYGINNRDLNTFDVDIETTRNLLKYVPEGAIVVSESGINATNVRSLPPVQGILVGTRLLRGALSIEEIGARVDRLLGKSPMVDY